MSKISIIIPYLPVSEKADDMTLKCVDLIYKNTYNEKEVIIISNGNVGYKFLSKMNTDCDIKIYSQNYGCAFAWDRGVEFAKNDIVILVNNDVFVEQDWDKEMVERLSDKNIGATFSYSVLGTNDYRMIQYRARKDGFCFAFRKEVYDKTGPFLKDQPFHSYYEDDAFFAEIQFNLGMDLVGCPTSKVFHKGQGTTKEILDEVVKSGIDSNKTWFENKYDGKYPYLKK